MPTGFKILDGNTPGETEKVFMEYMKIRHPLMSPMSPDYAEHRTSFYTGAWMLMVFSQNLNDRHLKEVIEEVKTYIEFHKRMLNKKN